MEDKKTKCHNIDKKIKIDVPNPKKDAFNKKDASKET